MATNLKTRIALAASGKSKLAFDPLGADEARLSIIRIDDIEVDPGQPRTEFGDMGELKASIKTHGIMQPLIVSPVNTNTYQIIAGERRYRAALELGLRTVPAIVRTVAEQQRLELQIIENLHRKDLLPLEEARSYKRLMDEFSLKQRDLSERIGKSLSAINETLRLLDFTDAEMEEIGRTGSISKSVLLEIVKDGNSKRRLALLRRAKSGLLTVKEARVTKSSGRSRASKRRANSRRFITGRGEVVIKFRTGFATVEDMKLALQEAMEQLGASDTAYC